MPPDRLEFPIPCGRVEFLSRDGCDRIPNKSQIATKKKQKQNNQKKRFTTTGRKGPYFILGLLRRPRGDAPETVMEDIVEASFTQLLRGLNLVVRVLLWLVWELFTLTIGWYLGWPLARLATLGRWPRAGITDHRNATEGTQAVVILVGLAALFAVAVLLAKLLAAAEA